MTAAPNLFILGVLIVYPLATLLLLLVFPHLFDVHINMRPSLAPLVQTFANASNLTAVGNSMLLGACSAVVATILGTVTAFAAAKTAGWLKSLINGAVWVVFFTPSYIIAEGWIILMQDGGVLSHMFHLPLGWSGWFFTRYGLVLAMGFRYFPFVHIAMEGAIDNVGEQLLHAARTLGAPRILVFRKILLSLLMPSLLAGASIAFAEGFGDFGFAAAITPQMHIPLLAYQIYSSLNQAPVNYSAAAGLSLLLMVVTGGTLLLQMWWLGRRSYTTLSSGSNLTKTKPAHGFTWVTGLALGVLFVGLILPFSGTLLESLHNTSTMSAPWTLSNYTTALHVGGAGLHALTRSLSYALVTAIITTAIGLYAAHQMTFRKSAATRLINAFVMATIAVPGVVLAASYIFAWNARWLIPLHLVLYGTSACLTMAYVAGHVPYAVRLQIGTMSQIPGSMVTAARVLGAKNRTILWRIMLPLVSATTVSTFFLTFTDTVFELPASSLLYPAGEPPFPVLVDSKFQAFEWGQGAALAIMGVVVIFGLYLSGQALVRYSGRAKERKLRPELERATHVDRDFQVSASS